MWAACFWVPVMGYIVWSKVFRFELIRTDFGRGGEVLPDVGGVFLGACHGFPRDAPGDSFRIDSYRLWAGWRSFS